MSYGALSGNYDNSTADGVTESPEKAGGGYFPLRHPTSGHVTSPYATANRVALGSIPKTHKITQTGHQTSSFNGSGAWSDTWTAC